MERLVRAFYDATMFLKQRVEQDGWQWSTNYLREHVRCATGLRFSNSISPTMFRTLRERYPELREFLAIKPLTKKP